MRILCLSPHTDDCEIACGGAIAKLSEKHEVMILAFATEFVRGDLTQEAQLAAKALGAGFKSYNFRVRHFSEARQQILDDLILIKKEFDPNIVLLPSTYDTHQDHQVISQEAFRAFKECSMWGYEVPCNNLTFKTTGFTVLQEEHLEKKIAAVLCYQSQKDRRYCQPEFIRSQAIFRGGQIGVPLAETFEIIRQIS